MAHVHSTQSSAVCTPAVSLIADSVQQHIAVQLFGLAFKLVLVTAVTVAVVVAVTAVIAVNTVYNEVNSGVVIAARASC